MENNTPTSELIATVEFHTKEAARHEAEATRHLEIVRPLLDELQKRNHEVLEPPPSVDTCRFIN